MAGSVLVYGIDLVFHPAPPAASELFQKFESSWLFFGAAILCAQRGRVLRTQRLAWWLMALAMTLWGGAAIYFEVFLGDLAVVPVPSVADIGWIAFYLPAYAALISLLHGRIGSVPRRVWLDGLTTGLGVGGAAAALAFGVILNNTAGTTLGIAVNLAYPIGDLGLLALALGALTVTGWRSAGAWHWVLGAFAIFAVADSAYLVEVARGTYANGAIVDLGWPTAALLVGVAALRAANLQSDPQDRTRSVTVLPVVAGTASVVLLCVDHFYRTNVVALGLATATLLVIVARLHQTVRGNFRMLTTSRIEATTDPLTGLGNRRKLAADLADRLSDPDSPRPLTLTIFDLDGFKLYNDTFGHVAGDELLQRLGGRLSAILAGHGCAYRMGGDEFCAVWHEPDADCESTILDHALTALTETSDGFSVSCSWGAILLPDEASNHSEALKLADARMYARKRAGRGSAARQSSDVLIQALAERSSELSLHVDDVASLACATAIVLGLPTEDMELVRNTALLHDVGKIAIPREILDKTGPLDAGEWSFMKRHTLIGERIIAAAPALVGVASLVRSTHERHDGTGYPDGLAGADIPLIAAIISACDAYAAMTTDRCYHTARNKADAITELHRCSGTQFNPEVITGLVTALTVGSDSAARQLQVPPVAQPHAIESRLSGASEPTHVSALPGMSPSS